MLQDRYSFHAHLIDEKVRHRETERSVHCHKAIYWWRLDLNLVGLRDYTLNLYTKLSLSLLWV